MPCSSQNNSNKTKISQNIRQNKSVKLTITLDQDVNMISDLKKEIAELSKNDKKSNKNRNEDKPINRCHLCGKNLCSKATLKRHIKGVHEKSKEEFKRILEKMSFKNTGNIQNNEN